jgi:hypothetical protein
MLARSISFGKLLGREFCWNCKAFGEDHKVDFLCWGTGHFMCWENHFECAWLCDQVDL